MLEEILQKHRRWLELEERAQREQWEAARKKGLKVLEDEGFAIRGLVPKEDKSGFLGRTLIVYERSYGPERGGFRLSASDPVILRHQANPEQTSIRAVIRRLTPRGIELLFDDPPEAWALEEVCAVELGPNDVTFQRLNAGIDAMLNAKGRTRQLRDQVLGLAETSPVQNVRAVQRQLVNDVQSEALSLVASEPSLFLLHGPPGTGKTTVLGHAIKEAVAKGQRVLVGTPSNQAVDNVAHALLGLGVRILRLGHPSRVDPALHAHTLEGALAEHPQKNVAEDLFKQARKLFREANQKKLQGRARDAREQALQLRRDARALLDEAKEIEQRAVQHLIETTPVILATLTGLKADLLVDQRFDLGVIDEATQAVVPAVYPLLARVERLVMAGDHRQLGPTVLSGEAEKQGMGRSAFERLMERNVPSLMLTTQYRMHEAIMRYPSRTLYEDRLVAHESVAARDLGGVFAPLTFVDTAGRGFEEERDAESSSVHNSGEAALALRIARELTEQGVEGIGVLSPYDAQVQRLRAASEEDAIEVSSIDGFQGREKDVIIVSLVRSNDRQEIGFLQDLRRLNVALTRAKKALIVIGDSATISGHPFYSGFVDYAIAQKAHRTAWDWPDDTESP